MSKRIRLVLVGLVAVAVLAVAGGTAVAATGWQTFGSGSATGRGGDYGSPSVSLQSVTKVNPVNIRYAIVNGAGATRKVDINWYLHCWTPGKSGSVYKSGSYSASIGGKKTHTKTLTFNKSTKYCSLDVWSDYDIGSYGKSGKLTLKLQARY